MAIQAQCEHCGFRYAAPDKLAGKKVRCKRCGQVFALPGGADAGGGEEWGGSLQGIEETASQLTASGTGAGARAAMTPDPAGHPGDSIDAVLSGAHSAEGMSASEAIRSTQPFDFPYSREVDRFLPPVLVGIAGLLLVLQTFGADDLRELDRQWVPFSRLAMVLALYVVVIWPLSHLGVKKGVQAQRAHMPWSPLWKSFAAFSFPYALGYTLWLVGNNIPSLLLGCIAGLLVGLAAIWLLYRVRLDRGVQPLVYPAITFLVGIVIGSGFVFGINHTVNAITLGSETAHEFASSPILPGLSWDNPPPPPPEEPLTDEPSPRPEVVAGDAATRPAPTTQAQPPTLTGEEPVPAAPDRPAVDRPAVVEGETEAPPEPGPLPDQGVMEQGVAEGRPNLFETDPAPPPLLRPPDRRPPPPAPRPPDEAPVARAVIEPSPLVREARPTPIEPGFDRIVYALTSADHLLVVRSKGEDRHIERWHAPSWKRTGEYKVRPEAGAAEPFALSPGGALLATVVNWPTLSVQIWSFDENRVTQVLELDRAHGDPSLVGFVSPTQLIVHWERDGAHGLELRDLGRARPVQVQLPGIDALANNFALSPDGRNFAVAARTPQGPAVMVYPVGMQRAGRVLPIRLLDAQWGVEPTGLAYSPDGSSISAMFERNGNALICTWRLTGGREAPPLLYPAGALSAAPKEPMGELFSWIPNTGVWLIHGTDFLDSGTGRVIGQTGVTTATSHRIASAESVHVVHTGEDGQTRLTELLLEAGKLPSGE